MKLLKRYLKRILVKNIKNLCENGDEDKAIQRAREKYHQIRKEYSQPSKMIGCTTVYKLVEELKKKIDGE